MGRNIDDEETTVATNNSDTSTPANWKYLDIYIG